MRVANVCLVVAVLTITTSCDKLIATKEAQRSMSQTNISMVYSDLDVPLNEALLTKAADMVDRLPSSLSLEDRFRCSYETMVVVDLARKHAGKPSFHDTARLTDDDLSRKAVKDAILLSDQPFPASPVTEDFLVAHVAEYAIPVDADALFAHAVWRASYLRSVVNEVGVTGPKADRWLTKGRSQDHSDKLYRKRANLGIGERRCYDLLGRSPVAKQSEGIDTKNIAMALRVPN